MEKLKCGAQVYSNLMSLFLYLVKILQKWGKGFVSCSSFDKNWVRFENGQDNEETTGQQEIVCFPCLKKMIFKLNSLG